jgi:Ca2+-binding RTX toxin-like protein
LYGAKGLDVLSGADGNDRVFGQGGGDLLIGGDQRDLCVGGSPRNDISGRYSGDLAKRSCEVARSTFQL